jgi:hypothetical protein
MRIDISLGRAVGIGQINIKVGTSNTKKCVCAQGGEDILATSSPLMRSQYWRGDSQFFKRANNLTMVRI